MYKIGIDLHGVLTDRPRLMKPILQSFVETLNCEVHILTGSFSEEAVKELESYGYIKNIHYTHLFSILDEVKQRNIEITYDDEGNPWCDSDIWNSMKGIYCQRANIDVLYDDSHIYGEYMPENTQFYFVECPKTIALFVGRFQPFHKGHLEVVKKLSQRHDIVKIGIGSAQYSRKNPHPSDNKNRHIFDVRERRKMIERSLINKGIANFEIIDILDLHNIPAWFEYLDSCIGRYDIVYSNNPVVTDFCDESDIKWEYIPYVDRDVYSGTNVRQRIADDDSSWRHLVPEQTEKVIQKTYQEIRQHLNEG